MPLSVADDMVNPGLFMSIVDLISCLLQEVHRACYVLLSGAKVV